MTATASVEAATRTLSESQLDLLKTAVTAAESHLRAFDTKAQIMLAAFLLSLNPLLAILHASCGSGLDRGALVLVAFAVVLNVVAYGHVIWPAAQSGRGESKVDAFFLPGKGATSVAGYLSTIGQVDAALVYADEALKLATLRRAKSRRLRRALALTVGVYALVLAVQVSSRHCQ